MSVVHRDIFDFDRLQAWLWFLFFAAFPVASAAILLAQPRETPSEGGQAGAVQETTR